MTVSMEPELIEIAPYGDTLLILKGEVMGPFGKEFAQDSDLESSADDESQDEDEGTVIKMLSSSTHLAMGSPYFQNLQANDWSESVASSNGYKFTVMSEG